MPDREINPLVHLLMWGDGYGHTRVEGVYHVFAEAQKALEADWARLGETRETYKGPLWIESVEPADDGLSELVKWCHNCLVGPAPEFIDLPDANDCDFIWRALCRITGDDPDATTND